MVTLPPPLSALEARLGLEAGTLAGTDKARAEAAIEDATALALSEVDEATAEEWQTAAPPVVAVVILKAARREFDNPEGIYQETLGEHSMGVTTATGVYLTNAEKALLAKAAGSAGFTGSVRTPSAYGEGDTRWPYWDWKEWQE